jgi:hypothetical protein
MKERDMKEKELLYKLKIVKQNNYYRVRWDMLVILLSLWNSFTAPIEFAYQQGMGFFHSSEMAFANGILDGIFILDLILNFRTSFIHSQTGEEIFDQKLIAKNYLGGQFTIDFLSAIPFDLLLGGAVGDENENQFLSFIKSLKLFRVLRLNRLITYMNSTDDVKHSLRLLKLFFMILLIVHVEACLWFYLVNQQHEWRPTQYYERSDGTQFYEDDWSTQYMYSFYNLMLVLFGTDLIPVNRAQYITMSIFLLIGALVNAQFFGTIVVILQSFNRKSQKYQEQIDVSLTSMKNMGLPVALQGRIREF